MVILTKMEYVSKVEEFIHSEDIIEIKNDPTKLFQNKLKQGLSNIKTILSEWEKRKIINMNPAAPK